MAIFNHKIYQRIFDRIISMVVVLAFLSAMTLPEIAVAKGEDQTDKITESTIAIVIDIEQELPIKEWVLQQVAEAGLNPREAEIIIDCESRWNTDAMGFNYNRTADLGLWQINSIHKDITNADKFDYKKATEWAIAKRLKDGHWGAWTCARKIARR